MTDREDISKNRKKVSDSIHSLRTAQENLNGVPHPVSAYRSIQRALEELREVRRYLKEEEEEK